MNDLYQPTSDRGKSNVRNIAYVIFEEDASVVQIGGTHEKSSQSALSRSNCGECRPSEIAEPYATDQVERRAQVPSRQRRVDRTTHQQGVDCNGDAGDGHRDQAQSDPPFERRQAQQQSTEIAFDLHGGLFLPLGGKRSNCTSRLCWPAPVQPPAFRISNNSRQPIDAPSVA